ncbi:hypothetical protein [Deinococcus planocerae]|uniref:hypothetical protein n=1 Tax=Deinococcus planocerae TaxID=1737569 RepID=UPI0011AF265F|nr:hypothetical protein [Deinococcus planocerae]
MSDLEQQRGFWVFSGLGLIGMLATYRLTDGHIPAFEFLEMLLIAVPPLILLVGGPAATKRARNGLVDGQQATHAAMREALVHMVTKDAAVHEVYKKLVLGIAGAVLRIDPPAAVALLLLELWWDKWPRQ